ncbi:septum site-determining protein MinC [Alkalibacillus haloalkaliphilus]|uniref:septum site-determining protein MinC n=1 Tax=Alkalibacillus haloalkaliphilus TaxID=94136 RepID=UPI00030FF5E0|nr:septum site-determining protein MinC [Alkalibacillus haloalkaliphilus]
MTETNLYLTMKGTNEGIIVYLDDQCSFITLLNELGSQVKSDTIENTTEVIINCQNRYLQDWQREEIRQVVEEQSSLKVKSIESNVLSHEEALTWFDQSTIKPFVKTVRSGQVLHVEGDALILGDINPGATVNATGNIFVLGQLKGIAHAGYAEGTEHVVVASYMNPNQIRIANKISRAPDYEMQGSSREFAYINQETGQIELEQIHNLQKIRPNLTDIVERGL